MATEVTQTALTPAESDRISTMSDGLKNQPGTLQELDNSDKAAARRADTIPDTESEHKTTQAFDAYYGGSLLDAANKYFGKPEGYPDDKNPAVKMWDWLQNNPGHSEKRQMVMQKIATLNSHFIDAIRARLQKNDRLVASGREQLANLAKQIQETDSKGLLRTLSIIGQAYKMQDSTLANQNITTGVAATEFMDSAELAGFEHFLTKMEQVDVNELIDIITENQPFITMLAAMRNQHDQKVFDDSLVEKDRDQTGSQYYGVVYDTDENRIDRLKMKRDDVENPQTHEILPGQGVMVNHARYLELARMMGGNERGKTDTVGHKKRSVNRMAVESKIWIEILRYMNPDQKQYLAYVLKEEFGDKKVRGVLRGALFAGVVNNLDLQKIALVKGLEWVEQPKFKQEVAKIAVDRERNVKNIAANADQVQNKYLQNVFLQRGMAGLASGALTILGGVTAAVSVILNFSDAYNNHDNDTWGKKIKDAIGRIGKSGTFYLGLGEMALGHHLIVPFTYNTIDRMTDNDRKMMEQAQLGLAFDAAIVNHYPALPIHMLKNWHHYSNIAEQNKNDTNFRQGKKKRGKQELYEGDIKLTQKEAYELGYRSTKEAEADIRGVFKTATQQYHINSQEAFVGYLNQNVVARYNKVGLFTGKDGVKPGATIDPTLPQSGGGSIDHIEPAPLPQQTPEDFITDETESTP